MEEITKEINLNEGTVTIKVKEEKEVKIKLPMYRKEKSGNSYAMLYKNNNDEQCVFKLYVRSGGPLNNIYNFERETFNDVWDNYEEINKEEFFAIYDESRKKLISFINKVRNL